MLMILLKSDHRIIRGDQWKFFQDVEKAVIQVHMDKFADEEQGKQRIAEMLQSSLSSFERITMWTDPYDILAMDNANEKGEQLGMLSFADAKLLYPEYHSSWVKSACSSPGYWGNCVTYQILTNQLL